MANNNKNQDKNQSKNGNNNNWNKSGKNNSSTGESRTYRSKGNPVAWYSAFPQYLADNANIPFNTIVGEKVDITEDDHLILPGIMRLGFYPTIGYSADKGSAINRSAVRFYTYLRNIMKSAKNYDMADCMMYLMALDSCYMFLNNMKRAYGLAMAFTPVNKYYPIKLFQALGFDASILNNLADFRAYINEFAASLASYTLPAGIDIVERHSWMCSGVYVDSTTTRAQSYIFVPEGFWRYDNTVETGSKLTFEAWLPQTGDTGTTLHTLSDLQTIGKSLVDCIYNDEDCGDISGDFYTAYGQNTVKIGLISESYQVLPSYDETVLTQIENATIVGRAINTEEHPFEITQNPSVNNGAILFTPAFENKLKNVFIVQEYGATETSKTLYSLGNRGIPSTLLNAHKDHPSSDDVVEMTRLCAASSSKNVTPSETNPIFQPDTFGSDLIGEVTVFQGYWDDGEFKVHQLRSFSADLWWEAAVTSTTGHILERTDASGTDPKSVIDSFCLWQCFSHAPLRYVMTVNPELENAGESTETAVFHNTDTQWISADIDNCTVITWSQLNNINTACMLSLFNVPQMGKSLN